VQKVRLRSEKIQLQESILISYESNSRSGYTRCSAVLEVVIRPPYVSEAPTKSLLQAHHTRKLCQKSDKKAFVSATEVIVAR
jgi:hypothetical protein